jgi:hypothetical protein
MRSELKLDDPAGRHQPGLDQRACATGLARSYRRGGLLPLPCSADHFFVCQVWQPARDQPSQITAAGSQCCHLTQGGVDGVFLGRGLQHLLCSGELVVVHSSAALCVIAAVLCRLRDLRDADHIGQKHNGSVTLSRDAWVGIAVSVVLTVAAAGSAPWWWKYVGPSAPASAAGNSSQVVGMSGGCPAFQVFAQNRWAPLGAAVRAQPNVLSRLVTGYQGNMSIAVNGWVYGGVAYPTNTPPWNSNVWFHLADDAGWVSFAGVRATPTSPDPTGHASGGDPAATSATCEGAVQ